ncbi:hypothetical protein M0813_11648 [Anaeramoeba flamelloides]|uniref:Uncharacterized protein n=1 Tax=Anaeramoeba flamelloides TaxID=1746091 RepID=A0ABQ8ZE82_9EUKA|nr:hypothetical protein M0813_11648 [Anaeramoeba flamelloides]
MGNKNKGYTSVISDLPAIQIKGQRSWNLIVDYCPVLNIPNECKIILTPTQIQFKDTHNQTIKTLSYYDISEYGHKQNCLFLKIENTVCKFFTSYSAKIESQIDAYIQQIHDTKVKVYKKERQRTQKVNELGVPVNKLTGRPIRLEKRMHAFLGKEGKKEREITKNH